MSGISRMARSPPREKADRDEGVERIVAPRLQPTVRRHRMLGEADAVESRRLGGAAGFRASASLVRRSGLCGWVTNGYITENFIR